MKKKVVSEVLPLTALRFFLASWIVYFHLCVVIPSMSGAQKPGASPWLNTVFCAYVAVSVFFVLSGFVLALNYPLHQSWNSADRKRFFVARFSRIYPVYVLGLAAVAQLIVANSLAQHSKAILLRRIGSGLLNLAMVQSWIPQASITWNGPGWSLSDEAFFYLCFPVLGSLFFRISTIRKVILAFTGLWALVLLPALLSLAAHVSGYSDVPATARPDFPFAWFVGFNPLLNLPVFLSGIVACRCFLIINQSGRLKGKGYLLYLPSFALLFTLTSFGSRIPYPLMHNGLTLPASFGIILGLSIGDRYLCALLSNPVLVFLGKASYAEYLLHFPIRAAFEALGASWTTLDQIAYFVAVLAISAVVFHFYEEPLQRKLRRLLSPNRSTVAPSAVMDPNV